MRGRAACCCDGGFFVPGIRPPSVPAGQSLLRISLTSSHAEQQIDDLVAALREASRNNCTMPANLTPQYKKAEEEYRRRSRRRKSCAAWS